MNFFIMVEEGRGGQQRRRGQELADDVVAALYTNTNEQAAIRATGKGKERERGEGEV
jgi:hypothetical protein